MREIKRFLEEQYKVEVSSDLISTVTDSTSVLKDVIEWKNRPLELMYPVAQSLGASNSLPSDEAATKLIY